MSTYNNNEEKLLDRFGRENPFRVPEGYFDTFPNRVMSQITKKKKRRDPWRWAVAASWPLRWPRRRVTPCIRRWG